MLVRVLRCAECQEEFLFPILCVEDVFSPVEGEIVNFLCPHFDRGHNRVLPVFRTQEFRQQDKIPKKENPFWVPAACGERGCGERTFICSMTYGATKPQSWVRKFPRPLTVECRNGHVSEVSVTPKELPRELKWPNPRLLRRVKGFLAKYWRATVSVPRRKQASEGTQVREKSSPAVGTRKIVKQRAPSSPSVPKVGS